MISKWEREMLADVGSDIRKAVSRAWKNDQLSFWTGIVFSIDTIALALAIHRGTWPWILGVALSLGVTLGPLFRLQARRWEGLKGPPRDAETDPLP